MLFCATSLTSCLFVCTRSNVGCGPNGGTVINNNNVIVNNGGVSVTYKTYLTLAQGAQPYHMSFLFSFITCVK